MLRRGGNPFLHTHACQEPIRKSGHREAPPRAPEKGRPGPEREVIGSRSHNDSGLESAISLPHSAQLPLALKPQSQEGGRRDSGIQDADGARAPGFLGPQAPPPHPLPSSVRLLTFTSDPNRHLISPPQLRPTRHTSTPHTRSVECPSTQDPTQAAGSSCPPPAASPFSD